MKKIGTLLLSFAMLCTFAACSSNSAPAPGKTDTPAPAEQKSEAAPAPNEEAGEKILIGYAGLDDSQQHLIPVRDNVVKVAKEMGADVITVDNAGDGQRAVSNVDSLLLQGIDVLIEFSQDASVNPTIKEKCDAAGVPVIAIDIPVPGAPMFGADNVESGLMVGHALGDLAKENWNSEIDLVLLMDTPAAGEVVALRMNNIITGIKEKCPGFDESKVVSVDFKDDAILAQQLAADVLTANPDKRHILIGSINDIGAQGAFAAVEALNRDADCFIVNHGMSVQTRENLYEVNRTGKQNCWRGGVSYFLEKYGEYVVPEAIKLAKGETVADFIYMDHLFIDASTIEQHYPEEQWGQ